MWDETNFLVKGFINEVKGALTESGSAGGGEGFVFGAASSGFVGVYGVATAPALTFPDTMFASSATGELTN